MEAFDRHSGRGQPFVSREAAPDRIPKRVSTSRTPKAYRISDTVTGAVILLMVVFTPWAFGTTQEWAIWTMNLVAYLLGLLLMAKWLIRWRSSFLPARWTDPLEPDGSEFFQLENRRRDALTLALAIMTGLILTYTFISAVNARATYLEWERRFDYRPCLNWLPHSYDRGATWSAFWMELGWACFFWATRDWLLGKSSRERRRRHDPRPEDGVGLGTARAIASETSGRELRSPRAESAQKSGQERHHSTIPARLELLFWVLCINGSVLALEAILQRLSGTNRLLWLVEPFYRKTAITQFGPYAYRANAATYFNLVWPVCLGFWLVLRQAAKPSLRLGHRLGSGSYLVLLPGAVLMAACPIISAARGGAIVAIASILAMMILLLRSTRRESPGFRAGICSLFAVIVGFSAFLGLKDLAPRFQTIFTDQLSQRTEIYSNALPMAREYPVFGTGPGAFAALYQLYRKDASQGWAAYLHDDWLETRITFGWVGFGMILLSLGLVLARWFRGPGVPVSFELVATIWVALGGCLLHAKFDFPFQIYSLVLLFLLLCAVLFCLARERLVS